MPPLADAEARRMIAPIDLDEVIERALDYRPYGLSDHVWDQIRPLFLDCLAVLNPPSVMSFYRDARGLMPFLTWAHLRGFPLTRECVFHLELVETWATWQQTEVKAGRGVRLTKGSVSDYKTLLRRLGPVLNESGGWPVKASRVPGGSQKGIRRGYPDSEVEQVVRAVQAMAEGDKKRLAWGTLVMGLGFGPTVAEAQAFTGRDVVSSAKGVFAALGEYRERLVPVVDVWVDPLMALAAEYSSEPFIRITAGRNAYANAIRSVDLGRDVPAISPQRLRTTWMVDRMRAGVDPRVLRDLAGLKSLSFLIDMTEFMPDPEETEALAAMRHPMRDRT